MNFGECLERAIEEQELNHGQAAEILGVSRQRVSAMTNQRHCNSKTIKKIANALGYSFLEFASLGDDDA